MGEVPDEYRGKYLIEDGEEWIVRRRTAALVRTRHLDLHDRMEMRKMRGFDFIFCRNVLIYFDDLSRNGGCRSFLQCFEPRRLYLPGPLRVGGTRDYGIQAETV